MPPFRLRFPPSEIPRWASRYVVARREEDLLATVPRRVRAAGYLTKADLVELGEWKSPRPRPRIASNEDAFVREVTKIALSTRQERLRPLVLLALRGVGWPVASVVLHLCHTDRYPILDFRALWSASVDVPSSCTFEFWEAWTAFARETADAAGVSMRVLDRALWQYSKERRPRRDGRTSA